MGTDDDTANDGNGTDAPRGAVRVPRREVGAVSVGGDDATWLGYGVRAEPLDEPDRRFGVIDDGEELTFGTFPTGFTGRADVDLHEEDAGRVLISEVDERLYRRFGNGFERLDVDALVTDVVNTTLFTDDEARVLVLYGWFDMDREAVAEGLELTETEVNDLVRSARSRRARARATTEVPFPLSRDSGTPSGSGETGEE